MNNFTVKIDGTDYTSHAVFPFKFANLLDEQLDEAYITLKRIDEEYFLPLTPVTITVTSYPGARYSSSSEVTSGKDENGASATLSNNRVKCTMTFNMVVANDKAIEIIGARKGNIKKYNHELYLIERTKILEGYIGDSITFTNPLGNNFIDT
jgi:hypothetical protein